MAADLSGNRGFAQAQTTELENKNLGKLKQALHLLLRVSKEAVYPKACSKRYKMHS